MKTVSEIRQALQHADRAQLELLERALEADERKGVVSALEVARRRIEAKEQAHARVQALYDYQEQLAQGRCLVGLDEVGRGPLAGPLAVGAVVLPSGGFIEGIDDSKKLGAAAREELALRIKDAAVAWHVEFVSAQRIDEEGMTACLKSAFRAAVRAVESAGVDVELILLDGNPLHIDPRELSVVKGDARCASISCASIVAKVARDALMVEASSIYPEYRFGENKGYGSPQHIEAIKRFGLSPLHRASFCRAWTQDSLFQ